jgi:hypothetical protein
MAASALVPHIVSQGHDRQAMEVWGEGEDKGGRGWQQQERATTTVPFLKQSSGNKKAKESTQKTQQSTTKIEATGTFGCWKRRQYFKADRCGLGAG